MPQSRKMTVTLLITSRTRFSLKTLPLDRQSTWFSWDLFWTYCKYPKVIPLPPSFFEKTSTRCFAFEVFRCKMGDGHGPRHQVKRSGRGFFSFDKEKMKTETVQPPLLNTLRIPETSRIVVDKKWGRVPSLYSDPWCLWAVLPTRCWHPRVRPRTCSRGTPRWS